MDANGYLSKANAEISSNNSNSRQTRQSRHFQGFKSSETRHVPIKKGALTVEDQDHKGNVTTKLLIESEAARVLAAHLGQSFAFNAEAGVWHLFSGTHWQAIDSHVVNQEVTAAMFDGCEPIGFTSRYQGGVSRILQQANLIPLPTPRAGVLPFRNGVLDLATQELRPIVKEEAHTWSIPHDYRPGKDCPKFASWLNSATNGDQDVQLVLRAFIAAVLTGRPDLHKFLHLEGPGGTGKSTFLRLLRQMTGEANCLITDLRSLETNKFETANLYGKRLVEITDSDKYGGSVNVLKAATGQDPLRNERKHQQQAGSFTFEGMVVIASNEPLQSTDYTSGLSRRMTVIRLDRVIPPAELKAFKNAGGEEALHAEIPGIINWALELDHDQISALFMHPPDAVRRSTLVAMTSQNPLTGWITECLVPSEKSKLYVGAKRVERNERGSTIYDGSQFRLYPSYLAWCEGAGRESVSLTRFKGLAVDALRSLGVEVRSGKDVEGSYVEGVQIDGERAAVYWDFNN